MEPTRTCYDCKTEKSIEDFPLRSKTTGKRQYECRECSKARKRVQYQKNKAVFIKRAGDRIKRAREENKQKVWDILKASKCLDCGENDPRVLQFDHVRGRKKAAVSRLANSGQSWKMIEAEMAKCEVRCANCHIKKTWERAKWSRK